MFGDKTIRFQNGPLVVNHKVSIWSQVHTGLGRTTCKVLLAASPCLTVHTQCHVWLPHAIRFRFKTLRFLL